MIHKYPSSVRQEDHAYPCPYYKEPIPPQEDKYAWGVMARQTPITGED